MGVYIEGMEMPETCRDCRFSTVIAFDKRPLCDALVEYMSYGEWEAKRLDNCPLVEIPPHGDLIDRDALPWDKQSLMLADEDWALPCVLIDDAPTIIPAEEVKE